MWLKFSGEPRSGEAEAAEGEDESGGREEDEPRADEGGQEAGLPQQGRTEGQRTGKPLTDLSVEMAGYL